MIMKLISCTDQFRSYTLFDEIYSDKTPPEFGLVSSPWRMEIPLWRFFHAENRDMVPVDFAGANLDDSLWKIIRVPSVWQQAGYGYPDDLKYDAVSAVEKKKGFFKKKLADLASSDTDDDVGVYRAWIDISSEYLNRAVYFDLGGIRGRFEIYLNGERILESAAVYTPSKILLSGRIFAGRNLLTLLVYRLDADRHGKIRRDNGTFGFSGIFRMPEITAESLIELSSLKTSSSWITQESADENSTDSYGIPPLGGAVQSDFVNDLYQEENGKDAKLRVQFALRNHTDIPVPVKVICRIIVARKEYDRYNLPEVRFRLAGPLEGVVPAMSTLSMDTEIHVRGVVPWSDIKPQLYDLVIELLDFQDRTICVKKKRIGFRTVRVENKMIAVNGHPIPLHGVRYFDFDPVFGLSVPLDRMRQDVLLMKRANLNMVLIAHFPTDPRFLDLCDQHGLYVICQSRSSGMKSMIESLGCHPCIVMWSYAPDHRDEGKLVESKRKHEADDDTRAFYFEQDVSGAISDVLPFPSNAGILFGEWQDICLDREHLVSLLPPGRALFDTIIGRPRRKEDDENFRYIHQGDLEEYHEKMNVPIAQGIVSAFREPHPIYYEVRRQCETVKIIASPDDPSHLTIYNTYPLGGTGEMQLKWKLLLGGQTVRSGGGVLPSIPASGSKAIQFPFKTDEYLDPKTYDNDDALLKAFKAAPEKELILDISVYSTTDISVDIKDHEICFYQQVLLEDIRLPERSLMRNELSESSEFLPVLRPVSGLSEKIIVATKPSLLYVNSIRSGIAFSRNGGALCSFSAWGAEFLSGILEPSFYRAATNMDRSDQSFVLAATVFSKETDWRSIQSQIRFKKFQYEMTGNNFSMLVHYKCFAMKGPILVLYTLEPSGRMEITLSFTPRYDLLRFGFRVMIPEFVNRLSWYGRGFHESYPDRKESARIGFFEGRCEDFFHEYARPSETGSHCDTKVLILSSPGGNKIRITRKDSPFFSFTAAPFSPEDIDDHQHAEQLTRKNGCELFLDFYVKGIERTGKAGRKPSKKQSYRGTFVIEPLGDFGSTV